jgi:hypothetical protein
MIAERRKDRDSRALPATLAIYRPLRKSVKQGRIIASLEPQKTFPFKVMFNAEFACSITFQVLMPGFTPEASLVPLHHHALSQQSDATRSQSRN